VPNRLFFLREIWRFLLLLQHNILDLIIMELSKADKRLCRELINTGLERECRRFVEQIQLIANKPIPPEQLNEPYREENGQSIERVWHKRFIKLFRATNEFNRHVALRYDHATGSHYLDCVAGLFLDKWLTDDEIARFSDEPRVYITSFASFYSKDSN
jgi:hypothetical protein